MDALGHLAAAVESGGLEAVDRVAAVEVAGEIRVDPAESAQGVHAEHGGAGAARAQRQQHRQRILLRLVPGPQAFGQGCDGGRLEQSAYGQPDVQPALDAGDEPGGQQGVPAEGEEVVVDPDLRQAERFGEQFAQEALVFRDRCTAGPRGLAVRGGQGCAVHLSVGVVRQLRQRYDERRYEVGGQTGREPASQVVRIRLTGDIGDERLVTQHDHGPAHARLICERCLDLARLDADAADLQLLVGAADEVQPSLAVPLTRSPVRYIRAPVSYGFGTNRSAVSTGGPRNRG